MQSTSIFTDLVIQAIINDPDLIGIDPATEIRLVTSEFVPSPQLAIGDLTYSAVAGMGAKVQTVGGAQRIFDSTTGRSGILLNVSGADFTWVCTSAPVSPVTMYGVALIEPGNPDLWATQLFDVPVVIEDAGNVVTWDGIFGFMLNDWIPAIAPI